MRERGPATCDLLGHLLHEPAHDVVGDDSLALAVDAESRFQVRILVGDECREEDPAVPVHEGDEGSVSMGTASLSSRHQEFSDRE